MEKKSKVCVLKCENYKDVKPVLLRLVENLGYRDIFKNKKVLLKISLISGVKPEKAVGTHPEFVRVLIQIIKEKGGNVFVGDSCGIYGFTDKAFEISGIKKVVEEEKAILVNFDACLLIEKECGTMLKGTYLPKILFDMDIIISVPKLKTHVFTGLTGAVKNQMGILPGALKSKVHQLAPRLKKFSHILIDINKAVNVNLAIMDGIVGMEGDGPIRGKPKKANIVAGSTDLVALDSICGHLIGFKEGEVLTNVLGEKMGLGNSALKNIQVVGDRIKDLKTNFKKPKTTIIDRYKFISTRFNRIKGKAIKLHISSKCKKCGLCIEKCPVNAIRLIDKKAVINKKKCIRCYCCYEICPNDAIELKCFVLFRPIFTRKMKIKF